MKDIVIPSDLGAYREMLDHAMPDPLIREHPFYKGLADWVADHRTPILYQQSDPSEYANFSIAFNWLLQRDYTHTSLGPPETIQTMYVVHELTHMTVGFPLSLDEVSSSEYAELFTDSEYRASNETEILIHYRIPDLRKLVLSGTKIVFDIMREQGIRQPSAGALVRLRANAIESDALDYFFAGSKEDQAGLDRLKRFRGNRQWAEKQYAAWRPHFSDNTFRPGPHLDTTTYESVVGDYNSSLTQEKYEHNMIRNIRLGFALCGLAMPEIASFQQAVDLAADLEGRHATI